MNPYFTLLNSISEVDESTFAQLIDISKYRKVEKGEVLTEIGKIPTKAYLLINGVLRSYITQESGKQYNKRLYTSLSFSGALTAMIKKEPSFICIEAITESEIFEVDFNAFKKLCTENTSVNRLYSRVLERAFIAYEDRNNDLMTLTGTERYLKLREQIPNIDDLIPQYQIASYLNITPVQLSRIRKNL